MGWGVDVPRAKPRPGRPTKISPHTSKVIRREVVKDPTITAKEIKEDNPNLLGDAHIRIVQRHLHDKLGYRSFRAMVKPLLTLKQRVNRVVFAKGLKEWDEAKWRSVVWSHGSTFTVNSKTKGQCVWRKPSDDRLLPQYTRKVVKHPSSLMVWGCFSYYGLGELVFLEKNITMNKERYLELLCDYLPSSFGKCRGEFFMQDGAPCHTAKDIKLWLKDCMIPYFENWPGNSPDLNPIENLWNIIKRNLRGKDTSSLPKLQAAIQESWDSFSDTHLQNLASSVPKRLKDVIKRKGYPIGY